ncbi:DUF421 domain-containing protein [Tessaracoccus antarcticus]|uniref:DUF421 domain-containing protein n=1 Tax=Tessaracoccus antarcticus TaxID=2479848 RepID=A0A3M0GDF7_9ACTN|nr:YetF domain-containing protein [Tessaracoccus antarcticus]RMB59623.1 DUF421 domain-containing protein [Tessaracoccus antarcticus]
MLEKLLVTPAEGLSVVISTAALYWGFILIIRVLGQRALARISSPDLATVVALGAVIGRAALGYTPTLGAGLLALVTLFAMQAMAGQIRRFTLYPRTLNNVPWLLMAGTVPITDNLRRTHLAEEELLGQIRLAGIRHLTEVACVILETTGEISVMRRGIPIDRKLMADVRGIEHLPEQFFDDSPQ